MPLDPLRFPTGIVVGYRMGWRMGPAMKKNRGMRREEQYMST